MPTFSIVATQEMRFALGKQIEPTFYQGVMTEIPLLYRLTDDNAQENTIWWAFSIIPRQDFCPIFFPSRYIRPACWSSIPFVSRRDLRNFDSGD